MALNVKDTQGPKLALQFRAGGKETRAAMEATGDAYMGAGSGAAYTLGLSGANKALEALGLPATTGASEDLRESLASATMEGDQARGVYEYEYDEEPYDLIEIEWALVPATKKKATKKKATKKKASKKKASKKPGTLRWVAEEPGFAHTSPRIPGYTVRPSANDKLFHLAYHPTKNDYESVVILDPRTKSTPTSLARAKELAAANARKRGMIGKKATKKKATKKKATELTDYQIEALGQMHDDYRYGLQNSDTFLREHAAADFTDGEPGFEEIEQLETRGLLSSRGEDTSFGERRLTMVITDAGMSAYEDAREARSAAKKKAKKAPAKKKAAHAKKKAAKKTAPNSAQMKTLRAAATAFRKTHSGVSSHKRTTKEAGHMAAMEEMGLVRESLSTITPGFRTFQILNTGVALAEKAVKKKGTKKTPSAKRPKTRGETLTRPTGWRRGTRGGPVGAGAHGRAVGRRNPQDGTPQRAYISVQGSDPGEPGTNWYASLQGVVDRPLDKTFAARPHMRSMGEAMRWAEREAVAHGWRLDAKKRTGEKKAPPSKTKSTKKNGSCTYSAALPEYCIEVVGENETQARSIRDTLKRGIEAAADMCRMRPPVCRGNLGLTRDRMPQITGDANMREMLESDDRLDRAKARAIGQAGGKKSNHQTIQQQFLDWLETKGVRTKRERVRVGELMATQSEIKAAKAYSMANAHLRGDFPTIDKQIVISKDGYILDGHHRWAALLTLDPGRWMSVLRVGLPMSQPRNGGPTLLGEAAAFPGVYTANFTGEPLTEAAQRRYKRDHKSQLGPQRKATKAKSPSLSCAELERATKAKIAKL